MKAYESIIVRKNKRINSKKIPFSGAACGKLGSGPPVKSAGILLIRGNHQSSKKPAFFGGFFRLRLFVLNWFGDP